MLVVTMNLNEATTLYTKDGKKIGKVKMVDIRGNKVRVGFDFSKEEVAIARPGITVEEAVSICNSRKNSNNR